jgi:hypothetical protein
MRSTRRRAPVIKRGQHGDERHRYISPLPGGGAQPRGHRGGDPRHLPFVPPDRGRDDGERRRRGSQRGRCPPVPARRGKAVLGKLRDRGHRRRHPRLLPRREDGSSLPRPAAFPRGFRRGDPRAQRSPGRLRDRRVVRPAGRPDAGGRKADRDRVPQGRDRLGGDGNRGSPPEEPDRPAGPHGGAARRPPGDPVFPRARRRTPSPTRGAGREDAAGPRVSRPHGDRPPLVGCELEDDPRGDRRGRHGASEVSRDRLGGARCMGCGVRG